MENGSRGPEKTTGVVKAKKESSSKFTNTRIATWKQGSSIQNGRNPEEIRKRRPRE